MKNKTVEFFDNILRKELSLKHKPQVTFAKKIKGCFGTYSGKRWTDGSCEHKIVVSKEQLKNDTPEDIKLFCIMAHEYVHAWQMESKIDQKKLHNKSSGFKRWIKHFEKEYCIDIVIMRGVT